jgi:hypothetical protein
MDSRHKAEPFLLPTRCASFPAAALGMIFTPLNLLMVLAIIIIIASRGEGTWR